MEWIPVVSLIVSCLGIPTLAALIMTDIYKRRKDNSEKAKQKKQDELKQCLAQVVKSEVAEIKDDINQLKKDSDLTKQGLQATLRHDLYEIADKWLSKGYCSIQDKEDFENIYKKYHALGKNGVMDDIYVKVMELPIAKIKPATTRRRATHV